MYPNNRKAVALAIALALGCMNPVSFAGVRLANGAQLFMGDTLNPAAYGLPVTAREVPEKRGEYSAVFELEPGKFAAVSSPNPLFTANEYGILVPIRVEGSEESGEFVFDRLAGGTKIHFDLTHPRYTLKHDGHWYTVRFNAAATAVVEAPDTIAYQLADGITLRWSVEDNRVRKAIYFADPASTADLSFTVTSDLPTHLTDNHIALGDIFSFPEPFLTDMADNKLEVPVTLVTEGNQYNYQYVAPNHPYILDPSEGPNSPATFSTSNIPCGNVDWTNTSNATASDNAYAVSNNGAPGTQASYSLDMTNFGFSLPAGATVDGIEVAIERKCSSNSGTAWCEDLQVQMLKAGSATGNDKANTGANWATTDATATYGASSDLWGAAWEASDINASNFGISFCATLGVNPF